MKRVFGIIGGLTVLAACSSPGQSPTEYMVYEVDELRGELAQPRGAVFDRTPVLRTERKHHGNVLLFDATPTGGVMAQGELNMTLDFGDGSMSARADEFVTAPYTGTSALNYATIGTAEYTDGEILITGSFTNGQLSGQAVGTVDMYGSSTVNGTGAVSGTLYGPDSWNLQIIGSIVQNGREIGIYSVETN